MSNSEKILKAISNLIETGVLTSKDIRKEISTDLKFKKDKIINKLDLVSVSYTHLTLPTNSRV